jgi:hypothetical protein
VQGQRLIRVEQRQTRLADSPGHPTRN